MNYKYRKSPSTIAFNVVNYLLLGLFTLACVFPFYYIFINTISNNDIVRKGGILFWPVGVHFTNYLIVFKIQNLSAAAITSVARTVLGTAGTLLGSSFLGYALSRKEFWRRKFWYRFVIVTMYFNAGIIPWFVTIKLLGLVDNFLVYILPAVVAPFLLILFKTYIESLPASLEESAQIDGAGYLTRYFRIIMPLSTPILATIIIFSSVGQWNSFMDTLFFARSRGMYTLQYLLYRYLNESIILAAELRQAASSGGLVDPGKMLTPISVRMTVSMIVVIPIILVYPFFQRFYIKGIMIGAIKG
jgi:putative aldouronate transport system permease protein